MKRATVDTGGPDDVFVGARMIWMHVPRGGYGYAIPVPATVVAVGRRCIRVEVRAKDGRAAIRSVLPESLSWPTPGTVPEGGVE